MTLRNQKNKPRPVFVKHSPGAQTLAWGEISVEESTALTTIAATSVFVQVEVFDTNGPSNNMTPSSTDSHITIDIDGTYFISCPITLESVGGAGATFEFDAFKNNGSVHLGNIHVDRSMSGGGSEAGSANMSGITPLNEGDTVEVWVKNETNTQDLIVEDITLSVMRLGGQ